MKIAHIADVHIRGFQRHEEYRKSFEDLFESLSIEQPDVILVVGDIVHSKTHNITPELIEITTWFFKSLADVAPVVHPDIAYPLRVRAAVASFSVAVLPNSKL